MLIEVADDLLVDLPDQHHLDHRHGFGIGHAHAADEFGDDAVAFQGLVDLRTAAMNDNGVDPQRLEHDHIQGKRLLQLFVRHGMTAILDDEGFAGKAPDVGQRLHQRIGFFDQLFHRISSHLPLTNGIRALSKDILYRKRSITH